MSEAQEQPTRPKPGIFSSGEEDAMQSQKPIKGDRAIGKKSSEKQRKGTLKGRLTRGLLSSLALSSVMTPTMFIRGDTPVQVEDLQKYPAIVRELSQQDLERRVETLYQIKIISPDELPEVDFVGEKFKTVEWTREDIGRLMMNLDKLPPHFYLPAPYIYRVGLAQPLPKPIDWLDESWEKIKQEQYESALDLLKGDLGRDFFISREDYEKASAQGYFAHNLGILPAEFTLADTSSKQNKWIGECSCDAPSVKPTAIFSDELFKKEEYAFYRLAIVAHELSHRITTEEDQDFVLELLEKPKDVLMQDFLKPNLKQLKGHIGALEERRLDYGTTNTGEFLSVGSEFYLQGQQKFIGVYGILIGEEKAGRFYDHMRDNIFRGTEYKDYQKIVK